MTMLSFKFIFFFTSRLQNVIDKKDALQGENEDLKSIVHYWMEKFEKERDSNGNQQECLLLENSKLKKNVGILKFRTISLTLWNFFLYFSILYHQIKIWFTMVIRENILTYFLCHLI